MRIIPIVAIVLLIYLIITYFVFREIKRREYKDNTFYSGSTKSKKRIILELYKFFERFPLTKLYIASVRKKYEIYCPGNYNLNAKRTMIVSLIIWGICGVELLFVFLLNPSILNAVNSAIIIPIINFEILYVATRNIEVKLLHQMVKFFDDVRHYYYEHHSVDLAIQDATKNAGREIKAHANKIYEVITAEDKEKEIRRYNETIYINHLKLFLSACVQVKEFGDKELDGHSIFQSNLHHLKNEVQIEELKIKKIIYLFSGLIFMTVSPILALNFCKNFGISNVPELTNFYNGSLGMGILILSVITVVICYIAQTLEREITSDSQENSVLLFKISELLPVRIILDNYTERYYTKVVRLKEKLKQTGSKNSYRQFIVKQFIFAIFTFFFILVTMFRIHDIKKDNICNNVDKVEKLTSGATTTQIEVMKENIVYYVSKYKDTDHIADEVIKRSIDNEIPIKNTANKEIVIDEVLTRINEYRNEYFRWYELIFCVLGSIIAYYIPYWMLTHKYKLARRGMDQEVNQFHSIILMLMYLDNISTLTILETMEIFAVIFKTSIQECINDFNSGSEEALNKLKEKEPYETFARLVENLIISDKIGIVKAFDELAADRVFFLEKRKQENEILLKQKSDNATLIAYIPLALILSAYLIVPFVYQCFKDYQMLSRELFPK